MGVRVCDQRPHATDAALLTLPVLPGRGAHKTPDDTRWQAAAVVLQRTIAAARWPGLIAFAVRVAIHTGEAQLRDGDYHGTMIKRAPRLLAVASGREVWPGSQPTANPPLDDGLNHVVGGVDAIGVHEDGAFGHRSSRALTGRRAVNLSRTGPNGTSRPWVSMNCCAVRMISSE